jgi:hypothetical protein
VAAAQAFCSVSSGDATNILILHVYSLPSKEVRLEMEKWRLFSNSSDGHKSYEHEFVLIIIKILDILEKFLA